MSRDILKVFLNNLPTTSMIEYLEDRKSFYDYFATELSMGRLDGTRSQRALTAAVVEDIT